MLTQLQGKAGLLRQLGFVSATALVVSNMVGMGIFTTTGFMAGDLGSAKLILAVWLAGALFALAGALSYSELGINFPSSGGEYVYLTRAFGPAWGFMTGWVSFFADSPPPSRRPRWPSPIIWDTSILRCGRSTRATCSDPGAFPIRLGGTGSGVRVDFRLQHFELSGSEAHGEGTERADCNENGGDHRFHRCWAF